MLNLIYSVAHSILTTSFCKSLGSQNALKSKEPVHM